MTRPFLMLGAAALMLAACAAETPTRSETSPDASVLGTKDLNAYRASKGLPKVSYSKQLEKAAARHAGDMSKRDFRSHTGSDGSSVGDRVTQAGYKWCHVSENITWGRSSLAEAIKAWDASPGHRRNMQSRKARAHAVVPGKGGVWVMVLAAPC